MSNMQPDLSEARRLLDAGFNLVRLHDYEKRPIGLGWNSPEGRAWEIEDNATGYGVPLAPNRLCSIDPDNWELSVVGMRALGFDLQAIMAAGARSNSTRPGSGGRSAFAEEPDLSWIKFSSKETGTVLELRADSPNLQDCVPGLLYRTKDGTLCTQQYANGKRLDDRPAIPDAFLEFWQRCTTDLEYLRVVQAKFFAAISEHLAKPAKPHLAISGGRSGRKLAYTSDCRAPFNRANTVPEILAEHGYTQDRATKRYAPPSATGEPCVREIPGREGLWHSDHASDPLQGSFDAWVANVQLNFDGSLEDAERAFRASQGEHPAAEFFQTGLGQGKAAPRPFKYDQTSVDRARALIESAISIDDLMTSSAAEIRKLKGINSAMTKSLSHDFKRRAKKLGYDLTVGDIGKIIMTDEARESYSHALQSTGLTSEWVFLEKSTEFYSIETGAIAPARSIDVKYAAAMPADNNGNRKSPTKMFTEFGGRCVYAEMYWPKQGSIPDPFFEYKGLQFVNSYRQDAVAERADWHAGQNWRTVERHIRTTFSDHDADILIQWMAHNVQRPGEKILWSPVLFGVQGDGKTTIARVLAAAMGQRHVRNISLDSLFSAFTGWATGACVGVLEEIRVIGHSRHDVMNKLKPFISNQTVEVVRKGQDGIDVLNTQNYLACTNHADALVLDHGDRRWGVFATRFESRAALLAERGEDYWKALYSAIDQDDGEIRSWLLSVDLSQFNPNAAPETNQAKLNMIEESISDDESNIREVLSIEESLVSEDLVLISRLNEALKKYGFRQPSAKRVSNILRSMGYENVVLKVGQVATRVYISSSKAEEFASDRDRNSWINAVFDANRFV
jgi:hypothetical protein